MGTQTLNMGVGLKSHYLLHNENLKVSVYWADQKPEKGLGALAAARTMLLMMTRHVAGCRAHTSWEGGSPYWTQSHTNENYELYTGLSKWRSGKESSCQCRRLKRHGFDSWVGKIPWRRKWQPPPVLLPGKFHGRESGGLQSMRSLRVRHE